MRVHDVGSIPGVKNDTTHIIHTPCQSREKREHLQSAAAAAAVAAAAADAMSLSVSISMWP